MRPRGVGKLGSLALVSQGANARWHLSTPMHPATRAKLSSGKAFDVTAAHATAQTVRK